MKPRKHKQTAFGFIRLNNTQSALNAIKTLDGFCVNGSKVSVSLAKYNKDGSSIRKQKTTIVSMPNQSRGIRTSNFRDHRKYSDVLTGNQKRIPDAETAPKIIPIFYTLNAIENEDNVKMLQRAVVAENSEVIYLKQVHTTVSGLLQSVKGIFFHFPN